MLLATDCLYKHKHLFHNSFYYAVQVGLRFKFQAFFNQALLTFFYALYQTFLFIAISTRNENLIFATDLTMVENMINHNN